MLAQLFNNYVLLLMSMMCVDDDDDHDAHDDAAGDATAAEGEAATTHDRAAQAALQTGDENNTENIFDADAHKGETCTRM